MDQENRIVVLIDMDCFYCQVEEKLNPELKGKPIAVVQYNPWKGGGIIAVNYVARAIGVTRHMRGDEAKEKCPEIQLPSVPCLRGKADITKYRDAGKEVAKVLQRFTPLLERASIDEAYLDITTPVQQRLKTLNVNTITIDMLPNTFALGYDSIDEFVADVQNDGSDDVDFEYEHAKQLLVGAVLVSEIRAAVYNETGYQCSAGIAHNKILAKLVCGMNKPNKQTLLPKHCINILYQSLSIKKVKHLGGKFGDSVCETLKISKMGELQKFTEKELQTKFDEKNGTWLYNIARGIDLEPVQAKFNPKSIGCCKQFRGKTALVDLESLKKWLKDLGDEIEERLENDALENNRTPRQMVVSFSTQQPNGRDVSSSRSYNFTADDDLCGELFSRKALEMLLDSAEGVKPKDEEGNRHLKAPIKFLGISVGKFEEHSENKKTRKINDYFSGASCSKDISSDKVITKNIKNICKTEDKNEGKAHVFRKFFQSNDIPDNLQSDELKEKAETKQNGKNMLESSLDKQESFFAKFLKAEINKNALDSQSKPVKIKEESNRPITPDCNIVNIVESSNDTEYSGSTIDMEINKSISLFEEDPVDIDRVGNMRQLLNKSKLLEEAFDVTEQEELQVECKSLDVQKNIQVQVSGTFECPECGKTVSVNMFDTHADYHFALKLREEEREIRRKEVVDKNKDKEMNRNQEPKAITTRQEEAVAKNDGVSIANYFMKIDGSVPTETCSECGKRVPLEKFAEHLDFHEAQKLSRELNNRPIQGNSVKRKRKSASPVKKSKVPCKSIDLFFR